MVSAAASFSLPEAMLRPCFSVPALGMPLTAPTSGLCGLSLSGLALLTAWGQKGTGGALPDCGPWTGAAAAEAGETRERERRRKSRPSGQHLPPSAGREHLPLWVREEPSSQSAAGQAASVHPGSACVTPSTGEDSQATGVSEEEEGQEEGRRKKNLTRQILPAVPRTRAAGVVGPDDLQEFPSHLKPFCSSRVTTVTSRAVSYHRREKVAPGFKAIPSACCFIPAAALLKKRRRDYSRQHHGMLIMTSTGLAVLSFSLLLAMDLQWPLISRKRLYNSKWSYKAVIVGLWHPLLIGREARGNHTATLWTRSSTVAQVIDCEGGKVHVGAQRPPEGKGAGPACGKGKGGKVARCCEGRSGRLRGRGRVQPRQTRPGVRAEEWRSQSSLREALEQQLAGGGAERRDKHRVQKDPQDKRERQEERRKSEQQVQEREGRSGQSAAVRGGAAT
ncbi:uncharacterized protein LOC141946191 isoform X2 [Strix uralensis]|uniref:uncharacterized protein LOC141946191 isoform X2 n=1 Tax=Strix uralensis TaxID=36305 RepID=UPI003DA7722A